MISNQQLAQFVEPSNLIKGIQRTPTAAEIEAHEQFLPLPAVRIADLEALVNIIQPGARLRDRVGLNVRAGGHFPPPGGPEIPEQPQKLLDQVNDGSMDAGRAHCTFETIHPFSDGNGRSGRALWLWQMKGRPLPPGLFLHPFYYRTLQNFRV